MFTDAIDERTINITDHDYLNTVRVVLTEDGQIAGAVTDTIGDTRGMELFLQHRADGTDTEMHDVAGIDQETGGRVEITDAFITPDDCRWQARSLAQLANDRTVIEVRRVHQAGVCQVR